MTTRKLAISALVLWGITIAVGGYLFVQGRVTVSPDQRTAILLTEDERNLVLGEMRLMLESVQGIVAGMANEDLERVRASAHASGMAIAQNVPPSLMAKLPLDFKQLGMSVHRGFDELAVASAQEETPEMLMERLGEQLSRCTACHARFRIQTEAPPLK